MGTIISLDIAGISLDAAINHMGIDHGHLFQIGDLAKRRSDQVDYTYDYEDNPDEVPDDSEEAFCRPLSRVLPRLGFVGLSLEGARMEYEALVEEERSIVARGRSTSSPSINFASLHAGVHQQSSGTIRTSMRRERRSVIVSQTIRS